MNSNRRADLQRKLSLKAVPRPPEGLVDRIKADIPQYLEAETDRRRYSRELSFHLRVAASILFLVGSVVVAMVLVEAPSQEKASVAGPGPFAPAARALPQPATATTASEQARFEVAEDTAVEIPQIALATPPPPPAAVPAPVSAPARRRAAPVTQPMETGNEGGGVGGVVGGTVTRPAEPQATAMQDVTAPAAPPSVPPPPLAVEASAPALAAAEMRAEKTSARADDEVFGISVDPQNFHRIRATLESGGRPPASAVDVEALVNYFAGPPARRPNRGVRLDVEASPAAIEAEGDHAILRFSIDTPPANGTNAVAASNARLEVVFNDQVVAKAKRIGGSEPLASEAVLRHGTSVTGLYALELRPVSQKQVVATVRLHYVANGRKETITRHVRGQELNKSWQRASRRHRLASLGAVWGETLKGTAPGFDLARRAEELATQDPKDALAKELAAAANASADGGR